MKLSDRMGNTDDQLSQQVSSCTPMRPGKKRSMLVFPAVTIVLIICSFYAGTLTQPVEEVPVEPEIIYMEEIGLTLILPDSWKGKYAWAKSRDVRTYSVYHPGIRAAMSGDSEPFYGGTLFHIRLWDTPLTKEQLEAGGEWEYSKYQYIMTTQNGTYLLYYASDVQFTPETREEYQRMEAEISDIRFMADHVLG